MMPPKRKRTKPRANAGTRPKRRRKVPNTSLTLPRSPDAPPPPRSSDSHHSTVRESASYRSKRVGQNLYDLLGGRDEIINLLPVDPKDTKASALRDVLMSAEFIASDGTLKHRFDSMYLSAGYSAKDLFELFDNRQHATALVVASAAKPRLVSELVEAASVRLIPCELCGATMRIAVNDDDGEFIRWDACPVEHADDRGRVTVDGNKTARELYFDQFGFKQAAPFVSVDARQDNRRVGITFTVGMPGTSPSPLALIRALELVPDVGASRQLTEATTDGTMRAMDTVEVADAEVIER